MSVKSLFFFNIEDIKQVEREQSLSTKTSRERMDFALLQETSPWVVALELSE